MAKTLHLALVYPPGCEYSEAMRTLLFRTTTILTAIFFLLPTGARAEFNPDSLQPKQRSFSCPYKLDPGEPTCFSHGFSHYYYHYSQIVPVPSARPLPAQPADKSLAVVPYWYAKVIRENAPVFGSLEAAMNGEPVLRTIETGFDFVTYID